mmetsp:Transcript_804/g.2482  ORF Transcript_804/g.2482 Transcript_804/m.2482 type:complete len:220 (+) Transcript_804:963-1622(+)
MQRVESDVHLGRQVDAFRLGEHFQYPLAGGQQLESEVWSARPPQVNVQHDTQLVGASAEGGVLDAHDLDGRGPEAQAVEVAARHCCRCIGLQERFQLGFQKVADGTVERRPQHLQAVVQESRPLVLRKLHPSRYVAQYQSQRPLVQVSDELHGCYELSPLPRLDRSCENADIQHEQGRLQRYQAAACQTLAHAVHASQSPRQYRSHQTKPFPPSICKLA